MPSLTEAAAARAAAEQLDHCAVEHDIGRRNDKGLRIIHGIQILDNALLHQRRRAVRRRDTVDRAVLAIRNLVERRHIHALDLRRLYEKFLLTPALAFCLAVQVGKLEHDFLAVTDHEQIDKIAERLRVIGARAAACHNMLEVGAFPGQHRYAAQIEHVEDVGEGQFILQRKSDDIKIRKRVTAFEPIQRDIRLSHFLFHIDPWRKNALAPDAILVVEQPIQDARAEVRHADLIGVREAERKAQIHFRFVFHHRAPLTADIARRLLYAGQNRFHFFMQGVFLQNQIQSKYNIFCAKRPYRNRPVWSSLLLRSHNAGCIQHCEHSYQHIGRNSLPHEGYPEYSQQYKHKFDQKNKYHILHGNAMCPV